MNYDYFYDRIQKQEITIDQLYDAICCLEIINIRLDMDDNGRSFEGQHMKSAAEYLEYQGDPDNIQFLTRDEHLAAHKGSWQNPTNWYYNPETKEIVDFEDNKPIPCTAINLSEPVCSPVIDSQNKEDELTDTSKAEPTEHVKPS